MSRSTVRQADGRAGRILRPRSGHRFTCMTLPSAVLVLTASLLTIPVAARQFPHPEEESLAGQKVVLPELVSGKIAVLVLGFRRPSSTPTGAWAEAPTGGVGKNLGFALYQLAVIKEAQSSFAA